jgi:splicing factor 3A subunit 3
MTGVVFCLFQPIPYWLYKLHGLNISYNCEICGNFTYKGPKAFQRHFAVSAFFYFVMSHFRLIAYVHIICFNTILILKTHIPSWEKLSKFTLSYNAKGH